MILDDTDLSRKKSAGDNDHIDYINTNTRNMLFTINQMNEKIQSILKRTNSSKTLKR